MDISVCHAKNSQWEKNEFELSTMFGSAGTAKLALLLLHIYIHFHFKLDMHIIIYFYPESVIWLRCVLPDRCESPHS